MRLELGLGISQCVSGCARAACCAACERTSVQATVHTRRQLRYIEGYLGLGMIADALSAYRQIASDQKALRPVRVTLVMLYIETQKWTKAVDVAAGLVEEEPQVYGHWIQLAYATRRAAGLEYAREVLMKALALHPKIAMIHYNLACYDSQLGRLDDARVFLETACHLDESFRELAKHDEDLIPLKSV